jgi:hypothetical protein
MGDLEEAIVSTEGAAESLGDQYDTTAGKISNATRAWDNALVDVGEELNNLWESVLPALAWALENVLVPTLQFVTGYFHDIGDMIDKIMGFVGGIGQYIPGLGGTPETSAVATGSSLPVASLPSATSSMMGGDQIYQQFFIERGDFETVQEAAGMGVTQAQRKRGE